ncbi:MFS transporter [Umezawaea sp. Da 62-37]|uniref:MFS transporter n=1 Tax=Umezawaea sp. Da 62-37 TaxID=3075927 RepID=UPI0028F6F892|nr:MFS transporter [Umezawaea sp. Da 62-37]WNV83593.1 MFS transporter [Umezawaea sp. Da 62-37]
MSETPRGSTAKWWALGVLAMTELVIVLDNTIVTIALPRAQEELGLSDGQRQWVVTAYALAFGALLLLGGRIADYWGRKRTFMAGLLGFGLASTWGGLVQSGLELVTARGVQGAFAALLAPASLAMVTVTFPRGRDRNTAFAIFGTVAGAGSAIGLVLGGVLTEYASWRWCLLVNIVFVVIVIAGAVLLLGESKAEGDNRHDVGGAVTVTLGLGSLVYGFTLAEHGWGSADTILFLALGAALIAAFVVVERRVRQPLLPLRVVLDKVRGGVFVITAVMGSSLIGALLYLTFYFQLVLGMSPLVSGLANLPMTVVIFLCTPLATRFLGRFGPRPLMVLGPLISAAGLFCLLGITSEGNFWLQVLPGLVLLGIGLTMLFVPSQSLALAGVAPEDAGVASAVVNASLNIGGSVGLAVFTVIYANSFGAATRRGAVDVDAFTEGYRATFLAAGVAMVAAALVGYFLVRGRKEDLLPAWEDEDGADAVHAR